MKRKPFKRGDIIQHKDRSVYIVLSDEQDDELNSIAVVCETTNLIPPRRLSTEHTEVCIKIGEVE